MWRCTHTYIRRPQAFSGYVPPHFYAMSVSPPMPSPDQREAAIPDRGLLASVKFLVVLLGPFIPVNLFLTGRPNIASWIVSINRHRARTR